MYGRLARAQLKIRLYIICLAYPIYAARCRRTPGPTAAAHLPLSQLSLLLLLLYACAKLITRRNNEQFNNNVCYKDKSVTRQKGLFSINKI
uniref:Secreted protein n=1 Tax=Trichogramma kaykai TaxID=54128 RepID=A0ABD2XMX8_9HYME